MVVYNEEQKRFKGYKFIDLFCGIGGFHLALSSLGARCVFASDINLEACKTYKNNFNIEPEGDITKIKSTLIPSHEILCGGFPCQPFSISGNQQGFEDEQGRGKLFFDIVRIARKHKPKVIILENVKNFEKHDDGKTLKIVRNKLDSISYRVFTKVLCASDFGIPQHRERLYIVAFKKDLKIKEFSFPEPLAEYKVIKDLLINQKDNTVKGNYIITRDYEINKTVKTKERKLLRIGKIGDGRQGERIYSIMGQAATLSSQGGGLGGKTGLYVIRKKVRKLYPRECARLMGFPDDFILADSQEKNYKQFGNSVVVDVVQAILNSIADTLEKHNQL